MTIVTPNNIEKSKLVVENCVKYDYIAQSFLYVSSDKEYGMM